METETSDNSLRNNISQLLQAIADTASKTISLAALEGRLAGISLLSIVGLLLIGGFLIFAAWLTLLIAAALWLTSLHINLVLALFIITLFNLLLLIPVGLLVKYYFQKLFFPATRRQLKASKIQVMG